MYDVIIIGGGPAGASAAITACVRGKRTAIISNHPSGSNLYKAEHVDNYPGMPDVTGAQLSDAMLAHARSLGTEIISGKVQTVMPSGDSVWVGYGQEMLSARCVILAPGLAQGTAFPGEKEFLGRGVSYCATCDGMLYRGKNVCAVCLSPDAEEEAEFLSSIGCSVFKATSKKISVGGSDFVEWVEIDGERRACDGVFILRSSVAPDSLVPGLEMQDGHIKIGRGGGTNIAGIYAAGDCTGTPYQIAKAVGEGQLAAFSAVKFIDSSK